jgi:hypothetical protein
VINPHALETLYEHLGRPAWFWPAVFIALFLLIGIAGGLEAPQ